jgi:outer membrane protein OmpA-like peptidoglycan-associated protein
MIKIKYVFFIAFINLLGSTKLFAQDTSSNRRIVMQKRGSYDLMDSSLIPKKRKGQATDFANGQFDYPAKPRNQWEIGVNGGLINVSGDVRSKTPFNGPQKIMNTLAWGISIRKAWGYLISTRLFYNRGVASGFDHEASENYWGHGRNPYYIAGYQNSIPYKVGNTVVSDRNVYYSYKTNIQELSLQMVMSLTNLKFHKVRSRFGAYFFGGAGIMTYRTRMDLRGKGDSLYHFGMISRPDGSAVNNIYKQRNNVNKQLLKMFDDVYETPAEEHPNRGRYMKGTVRPIFNVGLGLQFRISKRISLQLEDKMSITMDDLIDGYRWQETPAVSTSTTNVTSAMTRDFDNLNYASLGLNVNIGRRSVDPLWWLNPVDYGYSTICHPILPAESQCNRDSDGDGISDCFDKCPNTAGGISVDTHGCPFDTDGDGVPDYKDRQLITPTECQQNVDADGVGKCPDPECCKAVPEGCSGLSGMVRFAKGDCKLLSASIAQLKELATSMRAKPNCNLIVEDLCCDNKKEEQLSWDRVNAVINYLVDVEHIDRNRFIFRTKEMAEFRKDKGDCVPNTVIYRAATDNDTGDSFVTPPHPNLKCK